MSKVDELGRMLLFFAPIFAITAVSVGILQYLSGVESVLFPALAYAAILIPAIANPQPNGTKLTLAIGISLVVWAVQPQYQAELPMVIAAILISTATGLFFQKATPPNASSL